MANTETNDWGKNDKPAPPETFGENDQIVQDGPLARGFQSAKNAAKMTTQLATGNTQGTADTVAAQAAYNRANPGSPEGQKLMDAWNREKGVFNSIGNVAQQVGDDWNNAKGFVPGMQAVGKDVQAMGSGIVEQVPNMIAPTVGMIGGGALGGEVGTAVGGAIGAPVGGVGAAPGAAVGGTVGTVLGGWAGASAGNALVEGGDQIQTALQNANIDPSDTKAVKAYLDAHRGELLKSTAIKGGVIGAVDTATAGLDHLLLTGPARAATNAALKTMGVDMADKAAVKAATHSDEFAAHIANDAAYQASKHGVGHVARETAAASLEPLGEFTGEYVGGGLANDNWDAKEGLLEAASSVGQSAGMHLGNKAIQYAKAPLESKAPEASGMPTLPPENSAGTGEGRQVIPPVVPPVAQSSLTAWQQDLANQEQPQPEVAQSTPPDGAAVLAAQQAEVDNARLAQQNANRAIASPDDEIYQSTGVDTRTPSQRMGIDPAAGSLSAGAAIAVDSGLTDQLNAMAATQTDKPTGKKKASRNAAVPETAPGATVDQATGEVNQIAGWSDEQLSSAFRSAQSMDVRRSLADEISRRRNEQATAQTAGQASQQTLAGAEVQSPQLAQADAQAPSIASAVSGRTDAQLQHLAQNGNTADLRAQAQGEIARRQQTATSQPTTTTTAPAPAAATSTQTGDTNASQAANNGPQTGTPAGAATQVTESPEARSARFAEAGQAWSRMSATERAGVTQAAGLNKIQQRGVPKGEWEKLNPKIQQKLADHIKPVQQTANGPTEATAAPEQAASTPHAQAEQAASEVLAKGGSEAEASRAATDSLIGSMGTHPDISIAEDAPKAVEAAKQSVQAAEPVATEGAPQTANTTLESNSTPETQKPDSPSKPQNQGSVAEDAHEHLQESAPQTAQKPGKPEKSAVATGKKKDKKNVARAALEKDLGAREGDTITLDRDFDYATANRPFVIKRIDPKTGDIFLYNPKNHSSTWIKYSQAKAAGVKFSRVETPESDAKNAGQTPAKKAVQEQGTEAPNSASNPEEAASNLGETTSNHVESASTPGDGASETQKTASEQATPESGAEGATSPVAENTVTYQKSQKDKDHAGAVQTEGLSARDSHGAGEDVTIGDGNHQSLDAGVAENRGEADRNESVPAGPAGAGREGDGGVQRPGESESGAPRDSRTVRTEPATADAVADPATAETSPKPELDADHVIEEGDIGKGGLTRKYRDNVAAIRILKTLDAEGRKATPEERKAIARYVGWGALKGAFDSANKQWAKEYAELRELLTDAEYKAALASTRNAHFTSTEIIKGIYPALERLGFTRGRVLEPSVGVGNFFGLMPAGLRKKSDLYGVELDPITSRIAAALYPNAKIAQTTAFENFQVPGEFFDLAIGNPPFGEEPVVDADRTPYSGSSIHNYFFAKSIDKLRPGGLLAMVVSHNFLDAKNDKTRAWIGQHADLIDAVRLPETAFKENAGTSVVTDIVVFQKRMPGAEPGDLSWVKSGVQTLTSQKTGESHAHNVNSYYLANPDKVLGTPSAAGKMYGPNQYTVLPVEGQKLGDALKAWAERLPEGKYQPVERTHEDEAPDVCIPDGIKVGSYFVDGDGHIQMRGQDVMGKQTAIAWEAPNNKAIQRMTGMIGLRDALRTQMRMERSEDATEEAIEAQRGELNKLYREFQGQFGYVNDPTNRRLFLNDTESPLLQALEFDYDKGVSAVVAENEGIEAREPSARMADIFTRRVMFPPMDSMRVQSAKDAMLASLNYKGRLDLDYMASLYDQPADQIVKELGDMVYSDPLGGIVMADEYLSGDVKTKLAEAESAALDDPAFKRNVAALKQIIPVDKRPSEIFAGMGAAFVPTETYEQFVKEITGADAQVSYIKALGKWIVHFTANANPALNVGKWGISKMTAQAIFEHTLAGQGVVVSETRRGGDGKPYTVVLEKETEAAREKQAAMKAEWERWLWSEPERAEQIAGIYNDKHNRIVERKFDGTHMTFPGMNPAITLDKHQKDGVWRNVQTRQSLLDKVVGAGKTFEVIATIMEMRRLGISRKPIVAVPNHLTLQWKSDFSRLYPGANVLAATPEDFSKDAREQFFSKIVTGDWDAVIVGHSSLKKIGLPPETEKAVLQEQIDALASAIEETKRARGDRNIIRDMEGIKRNLEAKMKERIQALGQRSKVLTFDELGVDALAIDELHEFKNLFYNTTMQRVPGMGNPAGSDKAFDLFVKIQHLYKTLGEKAPIIGATGTPVSNSLVEMFNMQRYMQYPTLQRMGLNVFDAWAKQFGDVQSVYEVAPSGTGYRQATRFSQFRNLPALMSMYQTFANTITLDDLKAQTEAQGKIFPVPPMTNGRPFNVVAKRSPKVADFMGVPQLDIQDGKPRFGFNPEAGETARITEGEGGVWKVEISTPVEGDKEINNLLGTAKTEADARLMLVQAALTPTIKVDPDSILGKFSRLRELNKATKGKVNALSLTGLANKAGLDYRLIDPAAPDFAGSKVNLAVSNMMDLYHQFAGDKGAQLVFCDLSVPLSARAGLSTRMQRAYVREDGVIAHKRGTLHTVEGHEDLPFIVAVRAVSKKEEKSFTVYDAASGLKLMSDIPSKKAAVEWAQRTVENPERLQKWIDARDALGDIEQGDIDAYNDEHEIDTTESSSITREDIAGVSGATSFSVYDDIRAKLLAQGVPGHEIAFIHDYDSPTAKDKLFKAVNRGDVRFLIGSTPKMGAGTNVQERLVGLHHIDAPWRPSDLEQREGRIIRRGNKLAFDRDGKPVPGFSVGIYRYATEQTYDTRRWQILEHKARAIEQLRHYDGTTNEVDDIDGEASNAADMKAAASGDPLILEETQLRNDVSRLENLQGSYVDEIQMMSRRAKDQQTFAEKYGPQTLATYEKVVSTAKDNPVKKGEFAAFTVNGKTIGNREDAVSAISKAIMKTFSSAENVITTMKYRGVEFSLEGRADYAELITPSGTLDTFRPDLVSVPSAAGFLQRFANYIERATSHVEDLRQKIAEARQAAIDLREEAAKPFPQREELDSAREAYRNVQRRLVAKGPDVPVAQRQILAKSLEKQSDALRKLGYEDSLQEFMGNNKQEEARTAEDATASSDAGPAVLSRASAQPVNLSPVSLEAAAGVVARLRSVIQKVWHVDLRLAASFDTLPADAKASIQKYGDETKAKGVFHNGVVYVIANEHTSEADLEATILHEIKGHIATRRLYGPLVQNALNALYHSIGGLKGLSELARKRGFIETMNEYAVSLADSDFTDKQRVQIMMEELLAHIAQEPKFSDKVKAIVGAIRDWLRKHGFKALGEYGETDLLHILAQADKALRTGSDTAGPVVLSKSDRNSGPQPGAEPVEAQKTPRRGVGIRPIDSALYGMAAEGRSVQDMLGMIAKTSRDPLNRQIARLLQRTGLTTKFSVDNGKGMVFKTGNQHTYVAAYDPNTDTGYLFRPVDGERNVLHEAVHAATVKALAKGGLAATRMRQLYRHVQRTGVMNSAYGMANVEEFVSEAFTNPDFQRQLKTIAAPVGSSLHTAWDALVRIIKSILGLNGNSKVDNALSAALDLGVGVMRENMALQRQQGAGPVLGNVASTAKAYTQRATGLLNETFSAPGKVSWWHKTIGTMYNLAERSPAFKRVYDAAQGFIDDVSHYANDAADMAPTLLPKLDRWKDVLKSPISAADNKAVARPVFDGTLLWSRDEAGNPVHIDDLVAQAAKMTADQKARRLLDTGRITDNVFNMWWGMKQEQFEKVADTAYTREFLTPGIVWTPAELQSRYGLNQAQIGMYQEFRSAADRSLDTLARADMLRYGGKDAKDLHDMVMDAPDAQTAGVLLRDYFGKLADEDLGRADQLQAIANGMMDRADKVKRLQDQGYAPLSRFGKYSVYVQENGEPAYFGLFETAREANQMAARMRAEYGDKAVTQGMLSQEEYKLFAGMTPETLELFGKALGLDATGDEARDQLFQQYLRLTKNNRSAMKRLMHRKGVAGFSEDVGRVLASFIYSNGRQTASGLNLGELGEAVQAIPKEQGQLKDLAVKLAEYVKNPQEEAQALRGLLFAQYLGGSIASAMVNMTQPIAVSFPYLSQFGGVRQAAAELAKAAKDANKKGEDLGAELAQALKLAEEDGTVSPQEVHQLMAQAQGRGGLRTGDGTRTGDMIAKARNAFSRVTFGWGKVFGMAEQLNRRMTYIAAYRIAKQQNIADPVAFARKAVIDTQFQYSKANKMMWGRGAIGGTLMTFKTYSIAYLELMHRMWTQGGKEGKRGVLLALGVMMLLGGAGGLPFEEDAEDVIDGLAQLLGYNFSTKQARQNFLREVFGDGAAEFVENGVSGLPGVPIDVSGRLGMGNLIPGTGLLQSKTSHTSDVMELLGPVGDLAKRTGQAAGQLVQGNVGAAALQMAPVAVRNAAQGADMAATGMYRDAKGYKVIDTTPAEAVMKGVGFQPHSVAQIQEANSEAMQAKSFYNLRAQEIREQWAQGIFEKDAAKVQEARDAVADWNKKNPDQRMSINMSAVLRRVREMNKPKDERIAATAPKAMRVQMRKDLASARNDN